MMNDSTTTAGYKLLMPNSKQEVEAAVDEAMQTSDASSSGPGSTTIINDKTSRKTSFIEDDDETKWSTTYNKRRRYSIRDVDATRTTTTTTQLQQQSSSSTSPSDWLSQIPKDLIDPISERYMKFWFNYDMSSSDDDGSDNSKVATTIGTQEEEEQGQEQQEERLIHILRNSIQKGDVASVAMILHSSSCSSSLYYAAADASVVGTNACSHSYCLSRKQQRQQQQQQQQESWSARKQRLLSLLHAATAWGNIDIVQLLLLHYYKRIGNKNDILFHVNQYGETSLHVATKFGKTSIARLLLSSLTTLASSDCHHHHHQDQQLSQNEEEVECCSLCQTALGLSMSLLNKQDNNGRTALSNAIEIGNVESVQFLLEMGSSINTSYEGYHVRKENILFLAVRQGDLDIVKVIINHLTKKDSSSSSRVKNSIGIHHHLKKVLYQTMNTYGETVLHVAVQLCNYEMCKLLLQSLVDNSTNNNNSSSSNSGIRRHFMMIDIATEYWQETPLHYAIESRNHMIINFLVNMGANVNYQNMLGETPLHAAVRQGNYNTIQKLLAFSSLRMNNKSNKYYSHSGIKTTRFNWNLRTHLGYTVLHIATLNGNYQILKLLLEAADQDYKENVGMMRKLVRQPNKFGQTALHFATLRGNNKSMILKLLLRYGGNLT